MIEAPRFGSVLAWQLWSYGSIPAHGRYLAALAKWQHPYTRLLFGSLGNRAAFSHTVSIQPSIRLSCSGPANGWQVGVVRHIVAGCRDSLHRHHDHQDSTRGASVAIRSCIYCSCPAIDHSYSRYLTHHHFALLLFPKFLLLPECLRLQLPECLRLLLRECLRLLLPECLRLLIPECLRLLIPEWGRRGRARGLCSRGAGSLSVIRSSRRLPFLEEINSLDTQQMRAVLQLLRNAAANGSIEGNSPPPVRTTFRPHSHPSFYLYLTVGLLIMAVHMTG